MFSFDPPFWLQNRHVQTIVGPASKHAFENIAFKHWEVLTENKIPLRGKLWEQNNKKKLAILYHGLGGHPDSHYILGTAHELYKSGFSVLRMAMRGAELEPPVSKAIYHGGLIQDLEINVQKALEAGYDKIFLLGFSLSANQILKWLTTEKKNIEKACVVSPPVRLSQSAANLDRFKNRMYQKYFLKKLKAIIQEKAEHHPEVFKRFDLSESFRSVQGYDEQVTCKLFDFKSVQEYYETSSSYSELQNIQNKVLIIHSKDDPFVESADLIAFEKTKPHNIQMFLSNKGGHMGFYEGKGIYKLRYWPAQYFLATEG